MRCMLNGECAGSQRHFRQPGEGKTLVHLMLCHRNNCWRRNRLHSGNTILLLFAAAAAAVQTGLGLRSGCSWLAWAVRRPLYKHQPMSQRLKRLCFSDCYGQAPADLGSPDAAGKVRSSDSSEGICRRHRRGATPARRRGPSKRTACRLKL